MRTTLFLASAGSTFGNDQMQVLLVVLAGTVILMFAIRFLGLWLEQGHPDAEETKSESKFRPPSHQVPEQIPPEIVAVIAAATAAIINAPHKIVSVVPAKPASVEGLMQHWSMEGRRQIYSSHNVR